MKIPKNEKKYVFLKIVLLYEKIIADFKYGLTFFVSLLLFEIS